MATPDYQTTHPKNRQQWRAWLTKNHTSSPGVWLVYYKKESGKPRMSYDESVEEALCFGWIDSLPRKLDAERSMLKFTPRKPKSVWSQLNKTRVDKLIQQGLMMPAGLASIERAKQNGSWETLTASDTDAANNKVPADLEKLLARNKKAKTNFSNFSMSIRKQFLSWIDSAKRPETRAARLQQTVLMAAANTKPGPKGFKL
ncbi:MAG: YdeI/OmpD-associated family protein [Chitinophagaceae bacterium]|nr:YdeI/OmpD-associated family protein [Chitinophagaceae bacterium]